MHMSSVFKSSHNSAVLPVLTEHQPAHSAQQQRCVRLLWVLSALAVPSPPAPSCSHHFPSFSSFCIVAFQAVSGSRSHSPIHQYNTFSGYARTDRSYPFVCGVHENWNASATAPEKQLQNQILADAMGPHQWHNPFNRSQNTVAGVDDSLSPDSVWLLSLAVSL